MNPISYHTDRKISPDQFIDILERSTLAERRPVKNRERIAKMLDHADILITAWDNEKLVGVSRALSDFSFCCYLSDLAVDEAYQKQGIGNELIRQTHEVASKNDALLVLLAAPKAATYYPKIGMTQFTDCFIIKRKE